MFGGNGLICEEAEMVNILEYDVDIRVIVMQA